MSEEPVIAFGQQPCGFFPRRFLVAKILTARRLQAQIGGRIVFFCHDSDHDPRETRTILCHRATGELAKLNFAVLNKVQRKFSPLYAKRIAPDWPSRTLRQLPNYLEGGLIEMFRKTSAETVSEFCLEMYRRLGLLDGIEVVRSSDADLRRRACHVHDFFVDVPYEGEIVRARVRDGALELHEGGHSVVALPAAAFAKEHISPTRDTRLRWMQSVIHCTHYVAGQGEQAYLHQEEAPDVTFVRRDEIARSDEAYTEFPGLTRHRPDAAPARGAADMARRDTLRIGISCFPSVGGSGTLATALGMELADRGHEVHFVCYERPFRLLPDGPRLRFHPVAVNDYDVLRFPDYTLPLSVRLAEVSRDHGLDLLHVHYAVPHATAAILARSMLPTGRQPRVVTTLHGTDTTLLGRDPGYGPAIRYALTCSDAVTAVSASLQLETQRVFDFDGPIEVIHNFFVPRAPRRSAAEVRRELGLGKEVVVVHSSNLRPGKRIDLLLEAISRVRAREAFKLLVLAGESFAPFTEQASRLGLDDRVIVREKVNDVEEYLQVADVGLVTSDTESFCLSILEAMCFSCPSVSTRVGGIPEVVEDDVSGVLVPAGDAGALARALEALIHDRARRTSLGQAAKARARELFSAEVIVPRYEALYRRLCR